MRPETSLFIIGFLVRIPAHGDPSNLPHFLSPVENGTVIVGRNATLSCSVANLGEYKVAWVHVERKMVLVVDKTVAVKIPRFGMSYDPDQTNWRLHIYKATEEDKGRYMCQLNTKPVKNQVGFLHVVFPPTIQDEGTSPSTISIQEGRSVILKCQARGDPAPTINWRREDGALISAGSHRGKIVTSDRLVFTRVDRKLMGAYLCIASNGVPPIVSKRIQLDVEFPPKVETKEPQVTVKAGVEVHLTCVVESHPKSMHYWMRNQTIVIDRQKWKYETQEIHQYYRATLTLKIKNVDKEDSGTYTCVSRNSLGEDEANLRVTVSGSSVAPVANAAWTETGTEEDRNSADTCLNSELLFMMLLICLGVSTSSEFLENPWR